MPLSASRSVSARNTCGIEWAWMAIRLTAFSLLQRAEAFDDARGRQPEPWRAADFDRDQVAVFGLRGGAGGDDDLLVDHLFVDRLEPAAAIRRLMENPQHARLGMVDDLDDAAAVADAVVFVGFLDVQQHAVAEAGGFAGPCFARNGNADFRRLARAPLRPIRPAWR